MAERLTRREEIALRALDEARTGRPLPVVGPGDPIGVKRTMVCSLVESGLLPDSHYGPTLNSLYNRGLVDGYRMGYNSQDYGEMVWWITAAGKAALND